MVVSIKYLVGYLFKNSAFVICSFCNLKGPYISGKYVANFDILFAKTKKIAFPENDFYKQAYFICG